MSTTNPAVNVQIKGSADKPNLALLHGWGLNSAIWAPVETELANHFKLWMVDLPGFGGSPWHGESDFYKANNWLAENLFPRIGQPCHLLGWSLGGLIATDLAVRHPEHIKSLTLVASSPKFVSSPEPGDSLEPGDSPEPENSPEPDRSHNWPGIKPQLLEEFTSQLEHDFAATVDRFLSVQALGSPKAREEIKTMRTLLKSRPAPAPEALRAGLQWLAEVDLRQQQAEYSPVQRIFGRRDSLVPAALATQAGDIVFQKSAHAPFITEPELFVQTVRNFIMSIK